MSTKKTILVTGANGQQGSSVAKYLINAGRFHVRAFVRNINNPNVEYFKKHGCEVVQGDFENVESIDRALKGVYGVFLVTNFWDPTVLNEEKEVEQGKRFVDAIARQGDSIKHLVFSSLTWVSKVSGGKLHTPHCDSKGRIEEYAVQKLGRNRVTAVKPTTYYENHSTFFVPRKQQDGSYVLALPVNSPMNAISIQDFGGIVAAVFNDPERYLGVDFIAAGEVTSYNEICQHIAKVTGLPVRFQYVPLEVWRTFPIPAVDDLANMFQFFIDYQPTDADVAFTHKVFSGMRTFATWIEDKDNQASIVNAMKQT